MTEPLPADAAMAELAPTGPLRAGLVRALTAGVFFVGPDGTGTAARLFAGLARYVGRPLHPLIFPNSGECTDALAAGAVDVAFMPVDEVRRRRVAFGSAYYLLESTYLVSAAPGIATVAEVDRPGIRVVGIAETTTIRAAARTLSHTVPVAVRTVEEAVAALRNGDADALALSRDALAPIAPTVPGSRITEGAFQRTTVSVAVPPDRPAALLLVSAWLDGAKRDGSVRAALDATGLQAEAVAP